MVNSVFNSVFSLLACRNQQYEAVTAVAHTTCAHPVIIIIIIIIIIVIIIIIIIIIVAIIIVVIIIIIIIIIIITLFYFGKIIQNKIYINQTQLQKASQQKMIKTNVS